MTMYTNRGEARGREGGGWGRGRRTTTKKKALDEWMMIMMD